jgi:hypothetical protein
MALPRPEVLQAVAIQYLQEGEELEEASVLGQCTLELGAAKGRHGPVQRIDITLRGCRKVVERLRSPGDLEEESPLRRRIRLAIRNALPCGYHVRRARRAGEPSGARPAGDAGFGDGGGEPVAAASSRAGREQAKRLVSGAERDVDYPALLRDVIEELESLDPERWEEQVDSLAAALRKAVGN